MMGAIKRLSSSASRSAAFSMFLALLERAERRRVGLLRVLTYHRVDEPKARPQLGPRLISAMPKAFDQQMAYLAANYHLVSMQEVLNAQRSGYLLPPRTVLVTFDDAYRDFQQHAWPILRRHGIPVTLFVATAFPDRPQRTFWWDRLHQGLYATPRRDELDTPLGRLPLAEAAQRNRACNRLIDHVKMLPHHAAMELVDRICGELDVPPPENYVLGWDALRRLAREGVTLGAHSRNHPLMNRVRPVEAVAEAIGSFCDLIREIGLALPIFAYPAGGLNDHLAGALKGEGFKLAFTTRRGVNDMRAADPLQLRRINVGRRTTLPILRGRLAAWSMHLHR